MKKLLPKTEARMDSLEIDKSPRLRDDINYLWDHGYVTLFSCSGHYDTFCSMISECPYIMYIIVTGDGEWELREGRRRGWELDKTGIFIPDKCLGEEQYELIKKQFGRLIPAYTWRKKIPL